MAFPFYGLHLFSTYMAEEKVKQWFSGIGSWIPFYDDCSIRWRISEFKTITNLAGEIEKRMGKASGRRLESGCPTLISVTDRCFTIVLGQLCRFYFSTRGAPLCPESKSESRGKQDEVTFSSRNETILRTSYWSIEHKSKMGSTFYSLLLNFFPGISNNAQEWLPLNMPHLRASPQTCLSIAAYCGYQGPSYPRSPLPRLHQFVFHSTPFIPHLKSIASDVSMTIFKCFCIG